MESKKEAEVCSMDAAKRKAIESVGWKVGDAADFLEMSEEERRQLDARIKCVATMRREHHTP